MIRSQARLDRLQSITGMSKRSIRKLCEDKIVRGIDICPRHLPYLNYENSSDWYIGHMKEPHIKSSTNAKTTAPLNIICIDIGPKLPNNNSNKSYPFFLIDRATSMIFIYFGKTKDQFTDILDKFYIEVVKPSSYQWNMLQSDGDSVILDEKVINKLKDLQVNYQISAPYKHCQNGFVERNIGLAYNIARMFMNQLKVSSQFLGEALNHACYMLNHARIPRGMHITPSEAFTSIKPDINNIPMFYQWGVSYMSKEERKGKGKMMPKARRLRFLGIASHYKDSYLTYDPNNLTVKVRHDVHWFREDSKANEERALKTASITPVPNNLEEALQGQDRDQWLEALHKEIKECINRGTFRESQNNKTRPIMKSKIVLTIKDDGTYKCRWVACGYSQVYGQDYRETYSPTVQFRSIVSMLHVGATMDYEMSIVDIGNAYLETKLDRPITMLVPPFLKFIMGWNVEYIDILGGLYGLKQAGLLWYLLLSKILTEYGLIKSDFDECCFSHPSDIIMVAIYVDDILIISAEQGSIDSLINYLKNKLVKVKHEQGDEFTFLGVRITRDRAGRSVSLYQQSYIESILGQELDSDMLPSRVPLKEDI